MHLFPVINNNFCGCRFRGKRFSRIHTKCMDNSLTAYLKAYAATLQLSAPFTAVMHVLYLLQVN